MEEFDVIVVGAGIEGSATAYSLAKQNYKTLLLEQFFLPHTRGSSHGQTRIIRKAYNKVFYATMMNEAYDLWHELEGETGTNLFQKTGLLVVGRPPVGSQYVKQTEEALASQNFVFQSLDTKQLNRQFPMMKFDEGDQGVYEKDAGVLKADKALVSYRKMFVQYGGVLRDGEPVTKVIPGDKVTIETRKQTYRARSVVLTVGAWAPKMLKTLGLNLPLKPIRINVCYWKQLEQKHGIKQGFPTTIIDNGDKEGHYYSLPADEYPQHMKVCCHFGEPTDPDHRDSVNGESDIRKLEDFVPKWFPYLEGKPSIVESCMYTVTPDEGLILDHHPSHRNIVIGAGFSGHGFKLAPVVGRILSDLAMQKAPKRDLGPVSIARFRSKPNQAKL